MKPPQHVGEILLSYPRRPVERGPSVMRTFLVVVLGLVLGGNLILLGGPRTAPVPGDR